MTATGPPAYGVFLRARSGADLVVDVPLGHGQDPAVVLAWAGWRIERPLSAAREGTGAITIEYAVTAGEAVKAVKAGEAGSPCAAPKVLIASRPVILRSGPGDRDRTGPVGRDAGLALAVGEEPVRRQRVSAAVLVVAEVPGGVRDSCGRPRDGGRCVLASRYSGAALRWDGTWGLPGGGIDEQEQPAAAARREAYEETGQDVVVEELAFVQCAHWVGRSPIGVAEDFQAIRLVYRGVCPAPGDVVVHDVGGTTSEAAWLPLTRVAGVDWAPGPAEQLRALGVLPG